MSETPRTFDPKLSWDSDEDSIIEEFYRPAIANCTQYNRLAGFFSSTSFAIIIREALDFIERGGKMRLVTSHQLTKKDQQQLKNATEKPEEILSNSNAEKIVKLSNLSVTSVDKTFICFVNANKLSSSLDDQCNKRLKIKLLIKVLIHSFFLTLI